MKINYLQKILIAYLFILLIYWILLQLSGNKGGFWNDFYSFSYGLIPLIGGFVGIFLAKPWGTFRSAVGKTIFYMSAGLLFWGFGSMIWAYYNFFANVAVPYPSFADAGFILAIPFWAIGILNLSSTTGAEFALERLRGKILLFIIPIIILVISYYLLIVIARGGVVTDAFTFTPKLFFDLAYPTSDVVILTMVIMAYSLSFKYLGGRYNMFIYSLLFGFILMYFADFIFCYLTTLNVFYDGDIADFTYNLALFFMTFGVFGFYVPDVIIHKKVSK